MDPFTIYALVIGGVFAALFILNTIRLSPILLRSRFAKQIFRHIVWPVLIPRTRLTPPITRGDAIVQSFYWGGTIVANVFRVQNLPQAASRAGSLTILHLVPLMAGSRLSFAADMIGLSLRTYQYLHNTLGVMLTAQLLSHIALLLKCGRVRILESRDRFGVIVRLLSTMRISLIFNQAGGSLLTVVAVAIPFLRRLIYEIFLWIHGYLPAVALFGIWWHIEAKRYIDRILLMTCMAVFLGFDIIRFVKLLYWNSTRKQILSRAVATERNGAVLLRITLARPWRIQPGDHVYLRCLSLSPRSVLESHPFSITWWERDSYDTDRTSTVYILANPQFGFTRRLFHRSNHNRPLKMLIDGPYGNSIKTARFTTILLFASGIGVAALMPFIKAAISRQPEPSDSVRRVSLIWEIERESRFTHSPLFIMLT